MTTCTLTLPRRKLEALSQGNLHLTVPRTVGGESYRRLEIDIPGLVYMPDFLDEAHERRLVEWIDQQEWSSELQRRVQHYGWRYDYKAREVDSSMRLGPLPVELAVLAERLFKEKLVPRLPDQVIVNEYQADQGITPHIDIAGFADGIATISLLESWEMIFHAPRSRKTVPRLLERRSVAVMQGEARYRWKHEIRKRTSEPSLHEGGKRCPRQRRISLTFRKVLGRKPPPRGVRYGLPRGRRA